MKLSIRKRLMLYFTIIILIFGLGAGILFSIIFSSQTVRIYKSDLEKRSMVIADTISEYLALTGQGIAGLCSSPSGGNVHSQGMMNGNGAMNGKGQGLKKMGYSTYVSMIDDIAMTDVMIVDQNSDTIYVGNIENQSSYSEMSKEIQGLTKEVFKGNTSFREIGKVDKTLLAGAPIYDKGNNVLATVILKTKLSDIDSSINMGITALIICLISSLVIGMVAALILSRKFTRPLMRIDETTRELTNGNYLIKTKVSQGDEIGSLAEHIDILADRLKKASEESAALEQMRRDYISNISHELRTPVTVIRGSLEAICDGVVSEKDKLCEYHNEMLKESIHLERMVNDLLELSRLQNPDYKIEKSPLNIIDVFKDSVRFIKHVAEKKNIEILSEGAFEPYIIEGDYGRLRQMFIIILDNAVKFSDEGQKVNTLVSKKGKGLEISITDFGIGIPDKDLQHIFDKFYKTSDERNSKGTGLGLTIAKEIAQRHNIKLLAKSSELMGTTFEFYIEEQNKLSECRSQLW